MKRFTKILSVILCLILVFSVFSLNLSASSETVSEEILPEAYYSFDGVDVFSDMVDKHSLSPETNVTRSAGYKGLGGVFEGRDWKDTLKGHKDFTDNLTDITVSLYAKADSNDLISCFFSTGWDLANYPQAGFSIGLMGETLFFDGEFSDDTVAWKTAPLNFDVTQWHQYAVSISNGGKTLTLYADGKRIFSETFQKQLNLKWDNGWDTYTIGANHARGGYLFKGMIDEVLIYSTGLDDNQIKQLLNGRIVAEKLFGDANDDGKIDVRDIVRLKRGLASSYEDYSALSDANDDSVINSLDTVALRQIILNDNAKAVYSDFTVASAFSDNMVLQRGKKVRIYGRGGEAGTSVKVSFGNQEKTALIGENGWEVFLDEMPASNIGKELKVTSENKEIVFKNVVVGEVFICSGQSNMAITYEYIHNKTWGVELDYKTYNNFSSVRVKDVYYMPSGAPIMYTGLRDEWRQFDNLASASSISAYALAFGLNLSECLTADVPVGLITCSVGGSSIESWLDANSMLGLNSYSGNNAIYYNGMLSSVLPYTARAFLWYQGCADSNPNYDANQYREKFIGFANMVRGTNGDYSLPFITTQLVQYKEWHTRYGFRQLQDDLEKTLNNVYMVCGIDSGCNAATNEEAVALDGIHPTDKWLIGSRAAGIAATEIIGLDKANIPSRVPCGDTSYITSASKVEGGVVLSVSNATWLQTKVMNLGYNTALGNIGGQIGYFEVLSGGVWQKVSAYISGANIVLSTNLGNITAVRYLQDDVFADGNSFIYNQNNQIVAPIAYLPVY